MRIVPSIAGARRLWRTGGNLGLDTADRVKYMLSWYLRRGRLSAMAPSHFVLGLAGGIRAVIRPNGIDYKTMADIFDRDLYAVADGGVKRILDLGANIGMATLYFASRCANAEFACVEPSPDNRAILREAVGLNQVQAKIFEGAIGTAAGEAELFVDCNPDMYSLVPSNASGGTLRVRQFTVPEIMATMGWDRIDLLKIDIEGYEKQLLHEDNEWLARVEAIIGEAHGHVGYGIDEVRADLEPWGFRVALKSHVPESGLTVFEARRHGS